MASTHVHTLVPHTCPDFEVATMVDLFKRYPEIADAYGVDADFVLKFINAGPLREGDWAEVGTTVPSEIEELGFLMLDCGQGRLDQHGKEILSGNTLASIDLLVQEADLHMSPLFL